MIEVQLKDGTAIVAKDRINEDENLLVLTGPMVRMVGQDMFCWPVEVARVQKAFVVYSAHINEDAAMGDPAYRKVAGMMRGVTIVGG